MRKRALTTLCTVLAALALVTSPLQVGAQLRDPNAILAMAAARRATIRWESHRGRDCHQHYGQQVCEGPLRVPVQEGEPLERARTLGLLDRTTPRRAMHGLAPSEWVSAASAAGTMQRDLLWPVPGGHWWRGYGVRHGLRRTRRGLRPVPTRHLHEGVDIGAPRGTPIQVVNDGLVVYSANGVRGYGNAVLVVHGDGAVTLYAHCSELYVTPGQLVRRGEVIAAVGDTGLAHGPHLHFEYRSRGRTRDPGRMFVGRIFPETPIEGDPHGDD